MRHFVILPLLLVAFVITTFAVPPKEGKLEIGASAPKTDVKFLDISGKKLSLADVKKKNGLLVMFSCNTCPYVIAWEDRYNDIAKMCKENGIGLIVLNSNEAKRDDDDSFDAMKEHAKEQEYDFYYVVDENHVVADAFGADRTPEVFLFNDEMKLFYTGAIDDNARNADAVKAHYLADAIKALINGTKPAKSVTKSLGCTIKRL